MSNPYDGLTRYELRHLPEHLYAADMRRELLALLAGGLGFLRAKTEARLAFDLLADYNRARHLLAGEPGFDPYDWFVRQQAPVLAEHPELFFQQAWNAPADGPVSQAAQRCAAQEQPRGWLEWVNRPRQDQRPACL